MRKTLDINSVLQADNLGVSIANKYIEWEMHRSKKLEQWKEIQRYIFATSTKDTTNSALPWKNTTTIPKLCQIRDNLHANYMATLFPKRKWLNWEGQKAQDETREKKDAIEGYALWCNEHSNFYNEVSKIVLDYIDYGNAFGVPYWKDNRVTQADGAESIGYVGPAVARISPLDIVFDPTCAEFIYAPKIIRSFKSLGEVRSMLEKMSNTPEKEAELKQLWTYMNDVRGTCADHVGTVLAKDEIYQVAGFDNYRDYLASGMVEILTFYGDLYDPQTNKLLQNHVIKVVDRHKIMCKDPHESVFGYAPIYHVGWRVRPDNLWAMGPLDNLVGLQYRIDHLENLKADLLDLTAFPMVKRKGYVEDFNYGPLEEIIIGDDGDVTFMTPDPQALMFDSMVAVYEAKMEEMAGAPKEAMGFRTPGEKTKYEVQRLELAGGRIFQKATGHFEQNMIEPLINGMLEIARRNLDKITIRSFDSEFKVAIFNDLTVEDITGNGILKPIAARHFAEQANQVQNISNFMSSSAYQDPMIQAHFSAEKIARMYEDLLELDDWHIVEPYVRIGEQADAQRRTQALQEQVAVEAQTPTGIYPGDHDPEVEFEASTANMGSAPPQG